MVRAYTWGLDLASSLASTGGIGALLQVSDNVYTGSTVSSTTNYYPTFDGNGNVASLVRSDGTLAQVYEYSAFGELLRSENFDTTIADNPIRFSSKYFDSETSLVYYGQRYYSPIMGRFVNQDPIQEAGGLNLYALCANDGINGSDYLGMDPNFPDQDDFGNGTSASSGGQIVGYYTGDGDASPGVGTGSAGQPTTPSTPGVPSGTTSIGPLTTISMDDPDSSNQPQQSTAATAPANQPESPSNVNPNGTMINSDPIVQMSAFVVNATADSFNSGNYTVSYSGFSQVVNYNPNGVTMMAPVYVNLTQKGSVRNNSGKTIDYWAIGWSGAKQGLWSALDGANPFGNPLANHGFYDRKDPDLKISTGIGKYAVGPLTAALSGYGALRGAAYLSYLFTAVRNAG